MPKKKKPIMEFRHYEVPPDEPALSMNVREWKKVYPDGVRILHFHNLMEIGLCHYGKGELVIGEKSWNFGKNLFSVIPANMPHATNSTGNLYGYWQYLFFDVTTIAESCFPDDPSFCADFINKVNQYGHFTSADRDPVSMRIIKSIFYEMDTKGDLYSECVRNLLKTLVIRIYRMNTDKEKGTKEQSHKGEILKHSLEYIGKHYMEELKISMIADDCHISEPQFRRIFKDAMNMSIVEYINYVRVQKACELLKFTGRSMGDIAQICGFGAVSTFNRNFKKIIGISPYQWKKHPENYVGKLQDYKISALKGWQ